MRRTEEEKMSTCVCTDLQVTQCVIARLQGRSWSFIAATILKEVVYDGPQLRRIIKMKLFPTRKPRRGK
jgi:hypothetical protein